MGARTPTALGGMLALTAGLLLGCGSSDSGSSAPPLSDAESLVGTALLPPDGVVSAADALGSEDLPPDASANAVVADDDLPPAG
jgi:hypothetical protein